MQRSRNCPKWTGGKAFEWGAMMLRSKCTASMAVGLLAGMVAAFVSSGAQAVSMTATANATHGQGDSCSVFSSTASGGPSFLPQTATWTCSNSEGFGFSSASASFGSVGAAAHTNSFPGGNGLSGEGAAGSADLFHLTGRFVNKITGFDANGPFVVVILNVPS